MSYAKYNKDPNSKDWRDWLARAVQDAGAQVGVQAADGYEMSHDPKNLLPPASRVGDKDRDETVEKLAKAFSTGHLDKAEYEARRDAALTSKTRTSLAALIRDLPPMPDPPAPPVAVKKKPLMQRPAVYRPVLALWTLVSVFGIVFPPIAAPHNPVPGWAIAMFVGGFLSFFGSFVMWLYKGP